MSSSKQLNLTFVTQAGGMSQKTTSTRADANVSKTLKNPRNKRNVSPKITKKITESKKPFSSTKDFQEEEKKISVEEQNKFIHEDQKKEEEEDEDDKHIAPIFKKKIISANDDDDYHHADDKQEQKSIPKKQNFITPSTAPFPAFETWIDELGDWKVPLKKFITSKVMNNIYDYVKKEYNSNTVIYPPRDQIFNAYRKTPWSEVKVVIVGQDPYIKPNQAMGLSFSVPRSQKVVPPSLKAIYTALEQDSKNKFKRPAPLHGDLSSWADQGVFMLNASLTVKEGKSNSHKDCELIGWLEFTKATMQALSNQKTGIIFMLWGKFAQLKGKGIDRKKHHVLQFQHPSPLAGSGFKSCKDFSKVNEILINSKRKPIDWNLN